MGARHAAGVYGGDYYDGDGDGGESGGCQTRLSKMIAPCKVHVMLTYLINPP
jgi:hypothetical protein